MLDREIRLFVQAAKALKRLEPWRRGDDVKRIIARELCLPIPEEPDIERISQEISVAGRPKAKNFRKPEDFATLVKYMASLGYKQSTKAALDYWAYPRVTKIPPPSPRQIEEAVRRIKVWSFDDVASSDHDYAFPLLTDLRNAAELVRQRYKLEPLPTIRRKKKLN